jgi:hypothetical protein
MVFFMAFSATAFSASMDDLVGAWDTYSEAKLRIASIGSFSDANPSTTTLTVDGNFTLDEDSAGGPYAYTGTFSLIDGKKLYIELDQAGIDELVTTWINWAEEIAAEEGVTVSDVNFTIESLTITKPALPKKTNIPKKATVKARGTASAWINGEFFVKRFTYSSKVSFIGRQ